MRHGRGPLWILALGLTLPAAHAAAQALAAGDLLVRGSWSGDAFATSGLYRLAPDGVADPARVCVDDYPHFDFDDGGDLIALTSGLALVRLDPDSCIETVIASSGQADLTSAQDLLVADGFAYVSEATSNISGVIRIDLATGARDVFFNGSGLAGTTEPGIELAFPARLARSVDGWLYLADLTFGAGQVVGINPDPSNPAPGSDPADCSTLPAACVAISLNGLNFGTPYGLAAGAGELFVHHIGLFMQRFDEPVADPDAIGATWSIGVPLPERADIEVGPDGSVFASAGNTFPSAQSVAVVAPGGGTAQELYGPGDGFAALGTLAIAPGAGGADRDGDGIPDAEDLCPDYASADNADADGNGIGNVCECGDQNGDGLVDVSDILDINATIFGLLPVSPLCDANDDGACNIGDILAVNARIFGAQAFCARYPAP